MSKEDTGKNEPFEETAPKKSATAADAQEPYEESAPKKTVSALGTRKARKTPSKLALIMGTATGGENQPQRSPHGAIRTASGLRGSTTVKQGDDALKAKEAELAAMSEPWHALPEQEALDKLKTSRNGIKKDELQARILEYGRNELTPAEKMHPLVKFLLSMVQGFQLMMNLGALLCFIVYGIQPDAQTMALAIMLIVVCWLTSAFQTYQEGKADNIMEELKALTADSVWVVRDGELFEEQAKNLVPGDIVQVKAGEKVPADIRVLEATDLKVNNASLTGENVDIKLSKEPHHSELYEAKNIARSGCNFTCGHGIGLVFATGDKTFLGFIAKLTQEKETPDTLMAREIHRMVNILSAFAITLGIVFGILAGFNGFTWVQSVAFAIGIIVANVPEGLLSQLVVTLTITAEKLREYNVIVSNLEIIETLGAVTHICSDKTGTLTCNRMTASHVVYEGRIWSGPWAVDPPDNRYDAADFEEEEMKRLLRIVRLNTDAVFVSREGDDVLKWEVKGDASENALIKFAQPSGDVHEARAANPRVCSVPFNSTNKYMVSVNDSPDASKPTEVFMKGAPERVLARCSMARIDGKEVEFTPEVREHFENLNRTLARKGERVLAFASRTLPMDKFPRGFKYDAEEGNFPTEGLTLIGFISLVDPPRPAVPASVKACHEAGIKVYMVTGDHPETALAISRNIGLMSKLTANELREKGETVPENYRGAIAIHGTEMAAFTEEDWHRVLEYDEIVFARTMPQQKQGIVEHMQEKGWIVAMTGDGVNDAPALKAANVGVAMGSGASVAKEAAQIVVTTDDFSGIIEGIRRGRLVFDSMKKVITYVLVSNVPEILPFLFYVIAKIPLGIETIVILTIDLGTDILPAIALAWEDEESETMKKPPRGEDSHLVSFKMIIVSYVGYGIFATVASYFGFFWVLIDRGFTWDQIFGMGVSFRSDYSDLDNETRTKFYDICMHVETNAKYHEHTKNPNLDCGEDFSKYRADTLALAQAAFFIAVIWGQIMSIFVRKTFTESIFSIHRLVHNTVLLWSIVFEIALAMALIYIPGLNDVFMLKGPNATYLFCTLWYMPFLLFYEELRKLIVRTWPDSCLAWLTTY